LKRVADDFHKSEKIAEAFKRRDELVSFPLSGRRLMGRDKLVPPYTPVAISGLSE
jgi:hypothetical protein